MVITPLECNKPVDRLFLRRIIISICVWNVHVLRGTQQFEAGLMDADGLSTKLNRTIDWSFLLLSLKLHKCLYLFLSNIHWKVEKETPSQPSVHRVRN